MSASTPSHEAVGSDLMEAEEAAVIKSEAKDAIRWREAAQACIADLPAVEEVVRKATGHTLDAPACELLAGAGWVLQAVEHGTVARGLESINIRRKRRFVGRPSRVSRPLRSDGGWRW